MNNKSVVEVLGRALWDQAKDHAIIFLDRDGAIVGWAGAASDIFGFDEAEMIGEPLNRLFVKEDQEQGVPEHERALAVSAGRSEDDRWHVRKDGARIWVTGSLMALRDGTRLLGFCKIVTDRTNLRTTFETLQNRLEAAQHEVANRTVFFGRVAHEVRNCLSPIQSVASLIEAVESNADLKLPLAVIRRQVAQLERMMKDLTEVARLGVGKLTLDKRRFDLCAALKETAETVRNSASRKMQDLTVLVPSVPLEICADRERVHQIVFNLLHNAVKYTPEGGRIWLHCTVEPGYAVIKVEDTGVGISAELLPVIFDLFTQENAAQSDGGFGVGLSLVKDLADAHDGFVEVRCDGKGKGCVFAVRLPIALAG
jgi:two-component system CheB/CheR fusion protein